MLNARADARARAVAARATDARDRGRLQGRAASCPWHMHLDEVIRAS